MVGERTPQTRSVLVVVQSRQPGGQLLDGALELGVLVDEGPQLLGEPRQGDLIVTPARLELLDPSIGEVHPGRSYPRLRRKADFEQLRAAEPRGTLAEPTDGAEGGGAGDRA